MAQDGKSGPAPEVAFITLLMPTTGHMSHMMTGHERGQMK
jgi:hypothetical protein